MTNKSYPNKSITKFGYILKRIAEYQGGGIKINDNETSVEHILPKSKEHHTKNSYWDLNFTVEELDRFPHRLGNLTLLSRRDNKPSANFNESFSEKKTIYIKSSYEITKDICASKKWTPREIEKRQKEIAQIAVQKIWNFAL